MSFISSDWNGTGTALTGSLMLSLSIPLKPFTVYFIVFICSKWIM